MVAEGRPKAVFVDPTYPEKLVYSPSLNECAEQREAGLISPFLANEGEELGDSWTLSVVPKKAKEVKNQYSRVGILIEKDFPDFGPAQGEDESFAQASLEDLWRAKARACTAPPDYCLSRRRTTYPSTRQSLAARLTKPCSRGNTHETLRLTAIS